MMRDIGLACLLVGERECTIIQTLFAGSQSEGNARITFLTLKELGAGQRR